MLIKAVYDSHDQVPEFARAEYLQRPDGKWALKADAIEGGAEHLNPGLAANRDAIKTEKEAAQSRAQAAEGRAQTAEAELSRLKSPGTVILSADDAKAWKSFTELGDVKSVSKIVREYPDLKKKVDLQSQEQTWQEAAKDSGLSYEVLADQLRGQRGEGLQLQKRTVDVDDPENPGQKVKQTQWFFLRQEKQEGGNIKETEHSVLQFAQDNWPAWLVAALQARAEGGDSADPGGSGGQTGLLQPSTGAGSAQPVGSAVRLPNLGGSTGGSQGRNTKGGLDSAKIIQDMNAARDTRPNPLVPQTGSSAAK